MSLCLTLEQFEEKARQGNLVPLYSTIPADLDTPVSAFLKIRTGRNDFLLESVVGGEKWARYSFLGTEPRFIFRCHENKVTVHRDGHKPEVKGVGKDPLEILKEELGNFKPVIDENLPRFFGGAVGFFSYDMVRHIETIPATAVDDLKIDDACFLFTYTVVIFDNALQKIFIIANVLIDEKRPLSDQYREAAHKIERLQGKLKGHVAYPIAQHKPVPVLKPNRTEEEFTVLVERAKEYIRAGDIFQVQISTRFEGEGDIDPFALYRAIRRINPSPYLYFIEFEDLSIVGASPELMVRVENKKVDLRPIAGTRRRGKTEEDDKIMEAELCGDPKERAEHVMLVDLGRNDLGRVCDAGSVSVDELEVVERYSHVMHLVSHVSGRLKEGKDAIDVIRATYPAGTLTGAPKIRAMEIIEELEGLRRGIYGGSVGFISYTGNMDMAIAIRTAVIRGKKIYVQAAGGIVYDSVPKLEYKECQNKARGMMVALEALTE